MLERRPTSRGRSRARPGAAQTSFDRAPREGGGSWWNHGFPHARTPRRSRGRPEGGCSCWNADRRRVGGAGLGPAQPKPRLIEHPVKEGAHGGTTGSPTLAPLGVVEDDLREVVHAGTQTDVAWAEPGSARRSPNLV